MTISFTELFSVAKLFDMQPGSTFVNAPLMLGVTLMMFVIAAGLIMYTRDHKLVEYERKYLLPIISGLFWYGIFGLVLLIVRLSNVYFLSMRFFILFWIVSFLVFAGNKIGKFEHEKARKIT